MEGRKTSFFIASNSDFMSETFSLHVQMNIFMHILSSEEVPCVNEIMQPTPSISLDDYNF